MATYKVIQDVEADDKLVGPLSLRQFIYAGIGALSGYLGFLLTTKHAPFMLVIFVPITLICLFFAFPWGQDQPTEVWALAKIRFMIKPRKRVWDQSGAKELVTVNAPKKVEHHLTNGLNQDEVNSRLEALANTIDSRGWAVKNVNVNMTSQTAMLPDTSDRLVAASTLPQEVNAIDVRASDDMLDETANPIAQQFDQMINASETARRAQLVSQIQNNASVPAPAQSAQKPVDYWFMHQGPVVPGQATFVDAAVVAPSADNGVAPAVPQAVAPTPEEEALVAKFKSENHSMSAAYGHMKTIKTPEQLAEEAREAAAVAATKPQVTPEKQAAIMNLARNDDQDVATIARRAHQEVDHSDGDEIVVSLR
jgi:hypothetical protein